MTVPTGWSVLFNVMVSLYLNKGAGAQVAGTTVEELLWIVGHLFADVSIVGLKDDHRGSGSLTTGLVENGEGEVHVTESCHR